MAGHAEAPSGGAKLQEVSLQVDEVKSVMVDNINKVLDNADSLSVVETKSEGLRLGAQTFQRQATEVKNILWWRNFKVRDPARRLGLHGLPLLRN